MSVRGADFVSLQHEVMDAHDETDLIKDIFERRTKGRTYNPVEDSSATERLSSQIKDWQQNGSLVVMSFGCYDAPFHPNHQRFLLDCKLQGVIAYYNKLVSEKYGVPWEGLDLASKREFTHAAVADGAVKLVVSADGDERVAASKGFNEKKGGSERPILGWNTRAENLLGLSLQIDENQNRIVPVVDAVTIHDQFALHGTIHTDPIEMVAALSPDVWTLFYEAERDIETASSDMRLINTDIVVIGESRGYNVVDPMTGRGFSTTELVRRIRGRVS